MLSNVQIRLLHGVGYRSSGTFCLRDTAINCLGFRVCSHDEEDVHRVKRQLLRSDTSVVVSQSKSPKDKDRRSPTKKRKKKKKKEFSRYKSKTEKDQRSKVCGMFSTTRKRDNEFVVKELDFCHLASLYYIKVVNRIIKRATFFLYVRRPVLRPSSTTILAVTLCLCAIYVDQVFLFFSLVATISSRENSNSFL